MRRIEMVRCLMNYEGDAYVLTDDLWICVYRPEADLHFPISTVQESPWRIINWAVVKSPVNSDLIYVVILAPKDVGREQQPLVNSLLILESQFGIRTIRISLIKRAESLDSHVRQVFCAALLKHLAEEPEENVLRILRCVMDAVATERLKHQCLDARSLAVEAGISIKGFHKVRYIASFGGESLSIHSVDAITFDCANESRTILRTRSEVNNGHILLLSYIDYKFAELN